MEQLIFHISVNHFDRSEMYSSDFTTFFTFLAYSTDDKLVIFSDFSSKIGSDISCKLSPLETISMKCQILFSGKNKKTISLCRLLKILPRVLSTKHSYIFDI